ncbi:transposase [Isorropodon fossajaponicum symbiont]|uniref:transposase n=1 Tax=Isorropodon fossajaponicum symbiont TaxID=883811 RepID=UPI00191644F7|nr:transposase [Isorropodon fossajaponicum symbiont]
MLFQVVVGNSLTLETREVFYTPAHYTGLWDMRLNLRKSESLITKQQKQQNKQHSSIRYIVERTFGLLKLHHGLGKVRYLGLERNKTRAQLIAMSHNLKDWHEYIQTNAKPEGLLCLKVGMV